ncbi:MAG: carboxymuconolactone decarboxylase family protein [Armatimonadia bacterium]
MTREEIFRDIEGIFGSVPAFFRRLPDSSLSEEWELYKRVEVEDTAIGRKQKQLICLALAAANNCQYCVFYHTEAARCYGATEAEIADALACTERLCSWPCGRRAPRRAAPHACLRPISA